MLVDPRVDLISFTGSVPTGRRIQQTAATNFKKTVLELGGKSPAIVCPDANINIALEWVLFGFLWNAGQVCTSTSRLLLHTSVADAFISRLASEVAAVPLCPLEGELAPPTDGEKRHPAMGPIVSKVQQDKVLAYIQSGIKEGATLLAGGKPVDRPGFWVPPTIFTNVKTSMKIWNEEIFGPVLAIMTYDTEEEALRLANDTEYGLSAAVFSTNEETCKRLAKKLVVGTVFVNQSQFLFPQTPFGGRKFSGLGREMGREGMMEYLVTKTHIGFTGPSAGLYSLS
jgi:betaine-aldehyde dehydrogenase